jgi:hypothetical protein
VAELKSAALHMGAPRIGQIQSVRYQLNHISLHMKAIFVPNL